MKLKAMGSFWTQVIPEAVHFTYVHYSAMPTRLMNKGTVGWNILEVMVKRPSYEPAGRGAGLIAGLAIGVAIGYSISWPRYGDADWNPELETAEGFFLIAGCACAGGFLGSEVGKGISNGDVLAITSDHRNFGSLKEFSRFPINEPEFLKKVQADH